MKYFSFCFFLIVANTLFSSQPTLEEINKFSQNEIDDCFQKISIANLDEIEKQYQWGRLSAFYDIVRYIESNEPIPFVSHPSRRD